MTKRKRRALIWTGSIFGVFAILAIALLIFISTLDQNKAKKYLSAGVHTATGRQLSIHGDLRLQLGWVSRLSASEIQFQNAGWSKHPQMADVRLRAKKILAPKLPIDALNAVLTLKDGVLSFAPATFGVANGRMEIYSTFDGSKRPSKVKIDARLRHLDLKRFLGDSSFAQKSPTNTAVGRSRTRFFILYPLSFILSSEIHAVRVISTRSSGKFNIASTVVLAGLLVGKNLAYSSL